MFSCLILAVSGSLRAAESFELADGGRAKAILVVPEKATAVERFVAGELKDYLARITGAVFLIYGDDRDLPAGLNRISVGRTRLLEARGITAAGLEPEGFQIKTSGDTLFIIGADDAGTQYGAYEFLETWCGVRWFYPGEYGEEVPRQSTLRVGPVDVRHAPGFKRRAVGRNMESDYSQFGRKWKLGSRISFAGLHAWGQIAPPAVYGPTHPEYFAEVNGTRQRDWSKFDGAHAYQLCTSNPEVVKLAIAWVCKYFDENPGVDVVSISPNDGSGFCECERCRALDVPGEFITREQGRMTIPIITDRMFAFANAVAEGVAAVHPGKKLAMLAYSNYRDPPKRVKVHPNLVVEFCDNACFHWDARQKAYRVGLLETWAGLTPNLTVYEYYIWGGFHPVRGLIPLISESIKRFHRLGVRMFRTQSDMLGDFGRSGLNNYVAAKLLWNPELDPEAVVNDYCEKAFGGGSAPHMRRYFRLLDERWKEAVEKVGGRTEDIVPRHTSFYLVAYSPAARAELWALVREAEAAAGAEPQKARIRVFAGALRYAEMMVTGVEKILELERNGLVEVQKGTGSSQSPTRILSYTDPATLPAEARERARRLVRETVGQWEERERFIDQIQGQCVMNVSAIRTSEKYYRFSPMAKLKEVEAAYDRGRPSGAAP
ncbi:MAG: hypothetical protein A3G75_09500 [Verrucomicrobia bacterium RIFCSPLOWO2_12_FULL_64_8]|nr:MAG: hypothetical protein A3G75_09500 [Verrucomicrobia bacterium RIFCSPLOWO2_12_FULL_64_8]